MVTLEAEYIAERGAGLRQLPAAAVGELEARARIGARASSHVPLIGYRDLLGKIECHRPAAERSGAGVGYAHVQLERRTARIGRDSRTAVRGKCLIAQQQAGQQHSILNECLHLIPSPHI